MTVSAHDASVSRCGNNQHRGRRVQAGVSPGSRSNFAGVNRAADQSGGNDQKHEPRLESRAKDRGNEQRSVQMRGIQLLTCVQELAPFAKCSTLAVNWNCLASRSYFARQQVEREIGLCRQSS